MSDTKISEAAVVGYRWRHSAGEKWQYSDTPCGWEHEPLYLHLQPAELAEMQELDFYREHIGNDLDNLLIGAGVMQVTHEGGYEACWKNTMEAVERLAATGKQQVGEVEALPPEMRSSDPGYLDYLDGPEQVDEVQGYND